MYASRSWKRTITLSVSTSLLKLSKTRNPSSIRRLSRFDFSSSWKNTKAIRNIISVCLLTRFLIIFCTTNNELHWFYRILKVFFFADTICFYHGTWILSHCTCSLSYSSCVYIIQLPLTFSLHVIIWLHRQVFFVHQHIIELRIYYCVTSIFMLQIPRTSVFHNIIIYIILEDNFKW